MALFVCANVDGDNRQKVPLVTKNEVKRQNSRYF